MAIGLQLPILGRPLRRQDLADFPDDGRRYELVHGSLVVSPSPVLKHQRAVMRLAVLLAEVVPSDLEVISSPYDWSPDDGDLFQPDIVVIPRSTPGDAKFVRVAPALAVEVLSPSTRLYDRNTKRAAYAEAGLEWLWIVDPDNPMIEVYGREAGDIVVAASARGAAPLDVTEPSPATVVPADLVDD